MYLFGMESSGWDALSHGGTATVVVIVVVLFLKHIRETNIRQDKTLRAFEDKIDEIASSFQKQVSIIMNKNSEIATSSVQVQAKVEAALGNLERRVDGLVLEIGTLKGEKRYGSH